MAGRRGSAKPPPGTPVNWSIGVTRGLIGAWEFNEGGGLVIHDSTGRYGNGSIINPSGAMWENTEQGPDVAVAAASSQYIQIPDNSGQYRLVPVRNAGNGGFTTLISVYLNSNRNYNGLFTKTASASNVADPFDCYVDGSGNLTFWLGNGGSSGGTSAASTPATTWLQVALSVDIGAATARLFSNGLLVAHLASGVANLDDGAATIRLGNRNDNATFLDGKIGMARLWNRPLSDGEILQQFADPYQVYYRRRIWAVGVSQQTIAPTGKVSDFAAGHPTLEYNQTLLPGGKASDFAAGAPHVIAGINPTGKPSDFAVGIPIISLRSIGPVGKVSDFAAGNPLINLVLTVSPSGLASGFAAGRPSLIPAQLIDPTGLASGFVAGAPHILGGPQKIIPGGSAPGGLVSGFRAGLPTLAGGTGGVKVWIGGVDITKYISLQGVSGQGPSASDSAQVMTITSQTLGRWTAVFDYLDPTLATFPEVMQTFMVSENGVPIMSGGIVLVQLARWEDPTAQQSYHVTAQDWSAICDRRVVNATYPEGSDIAGIVHDIWNTVLLNPNEGLTVNNVPPIGGTLGLTDSTEVFAFVSVTQAFDQLATDTGCVWWVDVYADIHFVKYTSLASCPFSLTETSRNWRALSASATLLDARTKQWVVSNLTAVPGIASQTGGGGTPGTPGFGGAVVTETYTIPQAAAVARGFVLGSIITNFPVLGVTSLKVNGVSQPCLNGIPPAGSTQYNLQQSWWYDPGFPFINAPFAGNSQPIFPYPPVTSPYPMTGDVVEVKYIATQASQSAVVVAASPLTPATPGPGAWGSGEFDNVAQVKNVNLQGDLNSIASALLARSSTVPIQIQYETDEPGAQVGQQQSINIPLSFLSGATQWTITGIQMTLQAGVLEFGSQFRTVITATSGQDLGNAEKWFERLIARTEAPLPVQQTDGLIFVLAPGGSLAAGVPANNPVALKTAGILLQASVQCGVPPTGQNLVIDILNNGTSILVNKLVIPASSFAQVIPVVFAAGMQTVAIGDLLSVNVSYQVLTGAPTPAANVTVNVRWSTAGLPAGQTAPGVYGT